MRIVDPREEMVNFPGTCVFTGAGGEPLLDTGCVLNAKAYDTVDPHGYVSVGFVKSMAYEIGMVDAGEVARLADRVEELENRNRELTAIVEAVVDLRDTVKEYA